MMIIMKHFTHEEIALMSCYDSSSLNRLLTAMQLVLPYVEDKLAAETTAECIDKLCSMTDAEFPALAEQLASPEML